MNRALRDAIIQLITGMMQTNGNEVTMKIEVKKTTERTSVAALIVTVDGHEIPPIVATGPGMKAALANVMIAFMLATSSGNDPLH